MTYNVSSGTLSLYTTTTTPVRSKRIRLKSDDNMNTTRRAAEAHNQMRNRTVYVTCYNLAKFLEVKNIIRSFKRALVQQISEPEKIDCTDSVRITYTVSQKK